MMYLASPYSHSDPEVIEQRHTRVLFAAVKLLEAGNHVFSPIVYSYSLVRNGHINWEDGVPGAWLAWKELDENFIDRCDVLGVLMLPGWEESAGVAAEIDYAEQRGMYIIYYNPEELGV